MKGKWQIAKIKWQMVGGFTFALCLLLFEIRLRLPPGAWSKAGWRTLGRFLPCVRSSGLAYIAKTRDVCATPSIGNEVPAASR
jgi:hypothetical protein